VSKRALVLAHEPDGPANRVEERLVQRGFEVNTHVITDDLDRPNNASSWPSLDGYDLLVPMGSIRSLTDKSEISSWIDDEITLVRTAHETGTPVLGVCFGGHLIAEALGGSVETAPVTELGWTIIEDGDEANPIGAGPWLEWHHDRFTPPPGATVLARTEHAVQLMQVGRSVGTQFHPEVDVAHVETWLSGVEDDYLAEYGQDRDRLLDATKANEVQSIAGCKRLVDWFLDDVARL